MGLAGPSAVQGKSKKHGAHGGGSRNAETNPQEEGPTIEKILEDAKRARFEDETSRQDFKTKYHNRLSRRPFSQTLNLSRHSRIHASTANQVDEILHVVAKKPKHEFVQLKNFTSWVVKDYSHLLDFKISSGVTPLHLALQHGSHDFVEVALSALCESDKMLDLHDNAGQKAPENGQGVQKGEGATEGRGERLTKAVNAEKWDQPGKKTSGSRVQNKKRTKDFLKEGCHVDNNCLQRAIYYWSPLTESIIDILAEDAGHRHTGPTTVDDSESESSVEFPITEPFAHKDRSVFIKKSCNKHEHQGGWTALHFAVDYDYTVGHDGNIQDTASDSDEYASCQELGECCSADNIHANVTALCPGSACPVVAPGICTAEACIVSHSESSNPQSACETAATFTDDFEKQKQNNPVYKWQRRYNQLRVVKRLIEANPRALLCKDSEGHTPFQLRLSKIRKQCNPEINISNDANEQSMYDDSDADTSSHYAHHSYLGITGEEDQEESDANTTITPGGRSQNQGSQMFEAEADTLANEDQKLKMRHQAEVQIINEDRILSYIREYVIDKFDRRTAMQALYKPGSERTIEFDLSGLPYSSINANFLAGLGNVLHFEGLLKYVALPCLTVEDDPDQDSWTSMETIIKRRLEQAGRGYKGKGLQHMTTIFNWLKLENVRTVLKVTVFDDKEPSHSDEAIEACMEGLNVRNWNWRKMDLCSDVILYSAPKVTHVTLYSSGNNAVLVGWSSCMGLPQLKRLRKVRIYVREGLESSVRFEQYKEKFMEQLAIFRPDIKVSWGNEIPSRHSLFVGPSSDKLIRESKWMRTMKQFADFLRTTIDAQGVPAAPLVKIAIIDDGIDSTLGVFSGRIQTGQSFYKPGSGRGNGSYYVPTGPHGTLMAQLICEICPVVKLYIAQLEPAPRHDGRRGFTHHSAIEAINWAVSQGVDIISMSWSIDPEKNIIQPLDDALNEASRRKIVMFCSSIDEGPMVDDHTYPGRISACIKIGASAGDGAKLSWVSANRSNFLLPGDETVHVGRHSSGHGTSGNGGRLGAGYGNELPTAGSSISTALAAGLAGVLIYCDRLIHLSADPDEHDGPVNFQASGKMKAAFETMASETEDKKFLQVWKYVPLQLDPTKTDEVRVGSKTARPPPPSPLKWNYGSHPELTRATKKKLIAFLASLGK